MNMNQIKQKAKVRRIKTGKMKKTELIHTIQRTEGNPQCYGYSNGTCDQTQCCFRDDCFKASV